MLIYGNSEPKQLIKKKINDEKCPKCSAINSLEMIVYTGYHHLYGIPFGSMGKKGMVTCYKCEKSIYDFDLRSGLKDKMEKEKENIKIPLWYFLGIFLIGILAVLIAFWEYKEMQDTKEFIKNPQINDVYTYKNEVGHYTLFKIKGVTKDSITVIFNNYESTTDKKLDELDDSIKYDHENLFIFAKSQTWTMYENEEITKIDRD